MLRARISGADLRSETEETGLTTQCCSPLWSPGAAGRGVREIQGRKLTWPMWAEAESEIECLVKRLPGAGNACLCQHGTPKTWSENGDRMRPWSAQMKKTSRGSVARGWGMPVHMKARASVADGGVCVGAIDGRQRRAPLLGRPARYSRYSRPGRTIAGLSGVLVGPAYSYRAPCELHAERGAEGFLV